MLGRSPRALCGTITRCLSRSEWRAGRSRALACSSIGCCLSNGCFDFHRSRSATVEVFTMKRSRWSTFAGLPGRPGLDLRRDQLGVGGERRLERRLLGGGHKLFSTDRAVAGPPAADTSSSRTDRAAAGPQGGGHKLFSHGSSGGGSSGRRTQALRSRLERRGGPAAADTSSSLTGRAAAGRQAADTSSSPTGRAAAGPRAAAISSSLTGRAVRRVERWVERRVERRLRGCQLSQRPGLHDARTSRRPSRPRSPVAWPT